MTTKDPIDPYYVVKASVGPPATFSDSPCRHCGKRVLFKLANTFGWHGSGWAQEVISCDDCGSIVFRSRPKKIK